MTTAMPSSLTLKQKKRMWRDYKSETFRQISKDKSAMFNYFFRNNDIFKMMSKQDENLTRAMTLHCADKQANSFFGTFIGVLVVDQILLRFLVPSFRIPRFRFVVFCAKYLLMPCIGFTICRQYFMDQQQQFFFSMQQKYSFGFQDFTKGTKIFQRALQANRLQELMEKRSNFDWTGVPELQSSSQSEKSQLNKIDQ